MLLYMMEMVFQSVYSLPRLQAKVKESLDGTLGVAEKSISEAEAWEQASILSDNLEQATVQIQQSMVIIPQTTCY